MKHIFLAIFGAFILAGLFMVIVYFFVEYTKPTSLAQPEPEKKQEEEIVPRGAMAGECVQQESWSAIFKVIREGRNFYWVRCVKPDLKEKWKVGDVTEIVKDSLIYQQVDCP